MRNKINLVFILCAMFTSTSCTLQRRQRFADFSHSLSPSGTYQAIIEEFNNNGVNSYRLFIADAVHNDHKFETELTFRRRDMNFVFWADEEDILWANSGDIGTFFWVKEHDSWVKKVFSENRDAKVPQALKEVLPRLFGYGDH